MIIAKCVATRIINACLRKAANKRKAQFNKHNAAKPYQPGDIVLWRLKASNRARARSAPPLGAALDANQALAQHPIAAAKGPHGLAATYAQE